MAVEQRQKILMPTAKYSGVRGNDLKIVIKTNVDEPSAFNVQTVLGTDMMDEQIVKKASELVDNNWVVFKKEASLSPTAGIALEGGKNKEITGTEHSKYLEKIEAFSFNALGVAVTDGVTKSLYIAFVKRMRDEVGKKFQLVIHNQEADYMGVVNVNNNTTDENWSEASLVYWTTGVVAGSAVNKSATNKKYDGEFTVNVDYTQSQLEKAIKGGKFTFHASWF